MIEKILMGEESGSGSEAQLALGVGGKRIPDYSAAFANLRRRGGRGPQDQPHRCVVRQRQMALYQHRVPRRHETAEAHRAKEDEGERRGHSGDRAAEVGSGEGHCYESSSITCADAMLNGLLKDRL